MKLASPPLRQLSGGAVLHRPTDAAKVEARTTAPLVARGSTAPPTILAPTVAASHDARVEYEADGTAASPGVYAVLTSDARVIAPPAHAGHACAPAAPAAEVWAVNLADRSPDVAAASLQPAAMPAQDASAFLDAPALAAAVTAELAAVTGQVEPASAATKPSLSVAVSPMTPSLSAASTPKSRVRVLDGIEPRAKAADGKPRRTHSDDALDRRVLADGLSAAIRGSGRSPRSAHSSSAASDAGGGGGGAGRGTRRALEAFPLRSARSTSTSFSARQANNSSLLGSSDISIHDGQTVIQLGPLDVGDIRCAAVVASGHSYTVWCGEREGSISIRDADGSLVRTSVPQESNSQDFIWSILQVGEEVWVGTSSGRLRVYNAQRQNLLSERNRHTGGIYDLAFLNRFVYSASVDFTIVEWDVSTHDVTNKVMREHKNQVRRLIVAVGHLISCGDDHEIRVWDVVAGRSTHGARRTSSVLALVHVPKKLRQGEQLGGEHAIWAGDYSGTLSVYDFRRMRCAKELAAHTGPVFSLLHELDVVFSASADKTVKVWEPSSGECLRTITTHSSCVGNLAAVSHEKRVKLWSLGSDGSARQWLLERRGGEEAPIEAMRTELELMHFRVKQVEDTCNTLRATEESLRESLEMANATMEVERSSHETTERELRMQISELEAAVRRRDDVLAKKEEELDELRESTRQCELLKQELAQACEKLEQLERENKTLAEQVEETEGVRKSRRTFLEQVVMLSKVVEDVRRNVQDLARTALSHPGGSSTKTPTSPGLGTLTQVGAEAVYESIARAKEQFQDVINKHFTDDEKRHFGMPVGTALNAVSTSVTPRQPSPYAAVAFGSTRPRSPRASPTPRGISPPPSPKANLSKLTPPASPQSQTQDHDISQGVAMAAAKQLQKTARSQGVIARQGASLSPQRSSSNKPSTRTRAKTGQGTLGGSPNGAASSGNSPQQPRQRSPSNRASASSPSPAASLAQAARNSDGGGAEAAGPQQRSFRAQR